MVQELTAKVTAKVLAVTFPLVLMTSQIIRYRSVSFFLVTVITKVPAILQLSFLTFSPEGGYAKDDVTTITIEHGTERMHTILQLTCGLFHLQRAKFICSY